MIFSKTKRSASKDVTGGGLSVAGASQNDFVRFQNDFVPNTTSTSKSLFFIPNFITTAFLSHNTKQIIGMEQENDWYAKH